MNLKNPVVCDLLQYASNNNYCVELCWNYAVVDGFHGKRVFIVEDIPNPSIYAGEFDETCLISPDDFKRMFAKR
ncbi:hypothetical protein AH783_03820 [Salmonella enterica subsp. enterica serovar Rubislaw]|nr:hypothetical protein [Salmonella enterica subsp. enterica serovar Rubislaw]